MTAPLRLGLVGCGTYGMQMQRVFAAQQRMGRVHLVALAEPDAARRARAQTGFGGAVFADAARMMADCPMDAVLIATPDHLHAPVIDMALHHGLHVLTQKPLGTDPALAARQVAAFAQAGLILYVDLHKRFDPAHIRLRHDIASGAFGRLLYGSVHMEDRIEVPSVWLADWVRQSSPAWFLGVNFFDLVTWVTGLEPARVFATGQTGVLAALGFAGVWDSVQVKVDYVGGMSMHYDLSWVLPAAFPSVVNQGIRLVGTAGLAEVDSQDRGYFSASAAAPGSVQANPFGMYDRLDPRFGPVPDGYLRQAMTGFLDVLEAHRAGIGLADLAGTYPDGASALTSVRLAAAVDQSLASGRPEPVLPPA